MRRRRGPMAGAGEDIQTLAAGAAAPVVGGTGGGCPRRRQRLPRDPVHPGGGLFGFKLPMLFRRGRAPHVHMV